MCDSVENRVSEIPWLAPSDLSDPAGKILVRSGRSRIPSRRRSRWRWHRQVRTRRASGGTDRGIHAPFRRQPSPIPPLPEKFTQSASRRLSFAGFVDVDALDEGAARLGQSGVMCGRIPDPIDCQFLQRESDFA